MLDVIADFWKPVKKNQLQEKLQPEKLQAGSQIGFGFVPQAILSGHRVQISAINTYQFGNETMCSFVLSREKTPDVSMIIAEAQGEQYLAISRRLSIAERMKLFDTRDLESASEKGEFSGLSCRDIAPEFKGWVVASYKREIQGLKGRVFKGDYRKTPLPAPSVAQEFEYSLLVSESNEHAIEIEKYNDGRVEAYATIYRRTNDIGEVVYGESARSDIRLASSPRPETKPTLVTSGATPVVPEAKAPALSPKMPEASAENKTAAPIKLQEFTQPATPAVTMKKQEAPAVVPPAPKPAMEAAKPVPVTAAAAPKVEPPKAEAPKAPAPKIEPQKMESSKPATPMQKEKPAMAMNEMNGRNSNSESPRLYVQPSAPENFKQEVKAVSTKPMNNFDTDALECDLRVANKIIDEAIRNEMRLTDIVRRIIELPVAHQEAVHIPVTLTDEDFSLLAIRYGVSSSDRNAIKKRIIEDLNDFSGTSKKAA